MSALVISQLELTVEYLSTITTGNSSTVRTRSSGGFVEGLRVVNTKLVPPQVVHSCERLSAITTLELIGFGLCTVNAFVLRQMRSPCKCLVTLSTLKRLVISVDVFHMATKVRKPRECLVALVATM